MDMWRKIKKMEERCSERETQRERKRERAIEAKLEKEEDCIEYTDRYRMMNE